MMNAIGMFFGGKTFKTTNPFSNKVEQEVEVTIESKMATFEYLHDKFERKKVGIIDE